MDDDGEALEPSEVPDASLHCFRGHAGPARACCSPLRYTAEPVYFALGPGVFCGS